MTTDFSNVLVSGGTGFLGRHFIGQLIDKMPNLHVYMGKRRASVTHMSPVGLICSVGLELSDTIDLPLTADIVFHIAGEKRDQSKMWNINLEGTRRLLEWSAVNGVKRFVYLSSVGVYGASKDSGVIDVGAIKRPKNIYESSKSAAEDLVRKKCSEHGMEYVILQPSNVIGWAGDKTYPLLGLIRAIKRGWFTYFGDIETYFNYVAVEDVVSGLVAATSKQASNQTFIVNSPVPMRLFISWIAEELGVIYPSRRLPAMVGSAAALFADAVSGVTGQPIPFGSERYNELTNTTRFNGTPIATVLGNVYTTGIELAVRQLVGRYIKEGLL